MTQSGPAPATQPVEAPKDVPAFAAALRKQVAARDTGRMGARTVRAIYRQASRFIPGDELRAEFFAD